MEMLSLVRSISQEIHDQFGLDAHMLLLLMKSFPFKMVDYCKISLENSINSGQVFLWEKKSK